MFQNIKKVKIILKSKIKNINEIVWILFYDKSLKSSTCFILTGHLKVVIFQEINSHMWLAAAVLDSTDLY